MVAVHFDPKFTDDEHGESIRGKLAPCTASSAGIGRYQRHSLLKPAKLQLIRQGRKVVRRYMEVIAMRDGRFTALDCANALTDWIPVKLGLKPRWA
jgi:hypothetical protein